MFNFIFNIVNVLSAAFCFGMATRLTLTNGNPDTIALLVGAGVINVLAMLMPKNTTE